MGKLSTLDSVLSPPQQKDQADVRDFYPQRGKAIIRSRKLVYVMRTASLDHAVRISEESSSFCPARVP